MKKVIFLMLLIALSTNAFCQKDKEELGKAETFFSKKGSMIEKTFKQVGKFSSGSGILSFSTPVEVLKIKDLMKNDSVYCVRMSAQTGGNYSSEVSGYIDADEMDNVLNFIKLMNERYLQSAPPIVGIEVKYRCESGFEIGCFKTSKNLWNIYISPKYYSSATIFLEKEAINSLNTAMKQAKEFIDAKK